MSDGEAAAVCRVWHIPSPLRAERSLRALAELLGLRGAHVESVKETNVNSVRGVASNRVRVCCGPSWCGKLAVMVATGHSQQPHTT